MENIILIKGKVKFPITLDPTVWIFDDRKLDLDTYFDQQETEINELEEYTKSISKHWDREIIEGAQLPTTNKTKKKFIKEELTTGSFGIRFQPFLNNAEPFNDATVVIIESADQEYSLPIEEAKNIILGFSANGKPLMEDGPAHVYLNKDSKSQPIKRIRGFRVE
ncbi:peptidyl-prolyl cis-trans isomerase [Niallia endozanthoxylica]|uniref:Peptidyl-prolyl cis-trans isomerase n=1 Tax=Niallia endozanthoxylica TaxID=2036016 RepID=A0A5J5HTZ7_9BACI|nr:peptidyl-prolyl cis-trans isomerase [Niallia endozanthoxylica]KAA9026009.1 peptidyl-prolyl cis-trans isomerase [Niallia endozanthoxylica]